MAKETDKGYVLRRSADFRWDGAPDEAYKSSGESFRGVRRVNLAGMRGEHARFHLRYFEVEPGGFTSRERHRHEHVVVGLRGEGEIRIGDEWQALHFGDVAYVPPETVHQLRNRTGEPFGFLCLVDAERDRAVLVDE
jgi:ribulose-bisphosphate carboxylase large chain